MSEKVYANGIFGIDPSDKAPDYVIGSISIRPEQFALWMDEQEANSKGYIKLDISRRKDGKGWSFVLNTYEKKSDDNLAF